MIVGRELREWVADRAAQRRVQAAVNDFADSWNAGPVHSRFAEAMAGLPGCGAWAVANRMANLFADDAWVDTLIASLAEAMRADPCFEPPFRAVNSDAHTGLLVFENDNVALAAGVSRVAELAAKKKVKRAGASIGFSGEVMVLKFVRAGGAYLSFWEAPLITADFSAAKAGRCARTGGRAILDGEVLIVDGRYQTYVIEHARANLFVLQASVKRDQAPLSVQYDAASHEFLSCSATDDSASRIQMLTTLLRKTGGDQAFETVAAFLGHPSFFVRWHVMRELLGIDAAAALPHLARMAEADPHPEARRAAASVLERIEGEHKEALACPA